MSRLALYLLGPPRLELDGEPVQISRRKVVALLAYLAVTGTPHSRDALATLLWRERSQSRARAYLRRALSELNRTLGHGFLTIDRETAVLAAGADVWLDVDTLQERLAEGETHDHPTTELCSDCVMVLEEAVELYCDDFMAGFTLRDSPDFDEWQFFEREALRDELAGTLERLMRWHSSQREYDRAIAYARRWLALDPLHEPVHGHLMELYAQAGQRAAVVRQYQECVQILEAELGAPPAKTTTALYEQLQTKPEESDDRLFPTASRRHNLPTQTTPFIAREDELAEIAVLLQNPACRLLTLVGPGGSGKTRLALEAAEARIDAHEHGVVFVSLAPLEGANAIVPTVADALGFRFYSGGTPQEQLLNFLRQKNLLLIMDNYEHLLEGAQFATDIIKTAPKVKILATSRVRLNVGGEHRFQVGGMDYPALAVQPAFTAAGSSEAAQYSAVKLFTQGARRAQPGFELTDENVSSVVQICRLVEGMPLAIRLAAAWVEMLTSAEIAAEIRGSLDLLESERRDVPERQRSMRAAFDHSWHLLSLRQREVLAGLTVFRGGFTQEAAQAVTGASLRDIRALMNRSLLQRDTDPSVALRTRGRYQMHELLRQYAAEKLKERASAAVEAHDRHCVYYTAALQRWDAGLMSARELETRKEMDVEIENARAAWDWAVTNELVERLNQAVDGFCRFLWWSSRTKDGEAACRAAADKLSAIATGDVTRLLARVLGWQALFCLQMGRPEMARQLLQRSWALLERPELADQDTRREQALLHTHLGGLLMATDVQQSRASLTQSLNLYRLLDDKWWTAATLNHLGDCAFILGLYDEAEGLFQESLEIQQVLGHPGEIGASLTGLGAVAFVQGRFQEGVQLLQQAVQGLAETAHPINLAMGLSHLGEVLVYVGEYDRACQVEKESLAIHDDLGILRENRSYALFFLASAELFRGGYEIAQALAQELLDLSNGDGEWTIAEEARSRRLLGMLALVNEAYVEAQDQFGESVVAFREYGLPDGLAMTLADAAVAACGLAQLEVARQHLYEALQMALEKQIIGALVHVLPIVGLFLASVGELERAVELFALALRYPYIANSRWFEDVVGKHITAAAASLQPDVITAAQERGRVQDLWSTTEELLRELGNGAETGTSR
jgi:predicted ATPase/DNA-binding SARP family transcriptional activator